MSTETTDVRLARIETKIDLFLLRSDDHETRLRALERKVWVAAGAATALGGAAGTVAQMLGK